MRFIRCLVAGIVVTSLALGLVACGGAAAPVTAVPLPQAFQSSDGSLKLNYPAGWVATDTLAQVTLATDQAAIDAERPAPGQFQARLFATPASAIQGLPPDATPIDILAFFAASLSTSGVTFNPATELSIGGRGAARIEGSGTDGQAVVLAVDLGAGNYAFVTAIAAPGEISRFEPTLYAILETLVYTPFSAPAPEVTP